MTYKEEKMSYLGINEFVIGAIHDREVWFCVEPQVALELNSQFSPELADAQRFDDLDVLRGELETLPVTVAYKILEIQRCPKCKREFVEPPAISRVDNETEICPDCGVREAVEAFCRNCEENNLTKALKEEK